MQNKVLYIFLIVAGLLPGISISAFCQEQETVFPKYDFIRYDLNKIELPGDSMAFKKLMNKFSLLSDSNQGHINIVQIGGSHVQADMWTSRVRENFNRTFNQSESSRGMIFPYKAVKTNGSFQFEIAYNKVWEGYRNVKLTQPDNMGLMGWTATARDSCQFMDITMKGDTISSFFFDKLRIFHEVNIYSFSFTVTIDDSIYHPQYVDSCKCSEVIPVAKSKRFVLTVYKSDSLQREFTLHGIQTLLNEPGITYHSVGVNGASLKSYLNCNLLEEQLAMLKPDLIIFSIGINDSFDKEFTREKFEDNYCGLIERIRRTCPGVAFMFVSNTDSYKRVKRNYYKNLKGNEVKHSMYSLGKEYNAGVWDLFSIMGGLGSMSKWKRSGLAQRDMIHLTKNGYYILGDLMFEAFLKQQVNSHQNP